ncbi:MAG TPA: pyridoxamine 5'-phosphate oxidase [Solirubrobacteraceae bacterium]|nr:pyridoxamine 5'-phosphate oxidase [Solirubrobacteraceae bacterium]
MANAPRSALARILGWPARRLLDPRVRWAAEIVDERLGERVAGLHRHLELLEDEHRGIREKIAGLRVEELLAGGHGRPTELTDELGRFLNWAEGHEGYAAQAELWFNPPVALDYRTAGVAARHVNERIVEQPFVFAALAGLEPGARVLDVGGSESTVGLSLASLGYDVTVVDPRGYPLSHPGLRAAACRLDELDPDQAGFDAAVALSAVEHFGLGHYAGSGEADRLDIAALSELARRVRPGGLLVLTTPFGRAGVDDFERVYDAPGLAELLAGWDVDRATGAWRLDELTWAAGPLEEPLGEHGVALVVARNQPPPVALHRVGAPYEPAATLDPDDLGPDPIAALGSWLEEAVADGAPSPNAMLLATVDSAGQPHARYVLLRGLDADGLRFFTNRESPKAQQLDAAGRAAVTFGWHERHRQVRVTGRVLRVSDEDSDAYFASRPRDTQIGSWASDQSRPLESRERLDDRVAEIARRYDGVDVPRSPYWGGYVLEPETIEFWQGQPNRLHDRIRFTADGRAGWLVERLYP